MCASFNCRSSRCFAYVWSIFLFHGTIFHMMAWTYGTVPFCCRRGIFSSCKTLRNTPSLSEEHRSGRRTSIFICHSSTDVHITSPDNLNGFRIIRGNLPETDENILSLWCACVNHIVASAPIRYLCTAGHSRRCFCRTEIREHCFP